MGIATPHGGPTRELCSYLELSGGPSHLRYLLRRLRRLLPPDVPVLVGLWPAGEAILEDERLRAAVGADDYTGSLHEAVAACLEESPPAPHRCRLGPGIPHAGPRPPRHERRPRPLVLPVRPRPGYRCRLGRSCLPPYSAPTSAAAYRRVAATARPRKLPLSTRCDGAASRLPARD